MASAAAVVVAAAGGRSGDDDDATADAACDESVRCLLLSCGEGAGDEEEAIAEEGEE